MTGHANFGMRVGGEEMRRRRSAVDAAFRARASGASAPKRHPGSGSVNEENTAVLRIFRITVMVLYSCVFLFMTIFP